MLIRNNRPTICRCALAAITGLIVSIPVAAQDEFEEIVVIAQKREQNIMVVPVAVTSVSGAELEASGIRDVFEMQQNVPGLIVGQSQTSTTSNFAIRGVGSTSQNFGVESSVGLYVDEVYRSRQSSMINDLVDVHAVEVLRGPQGTLFGKNTPAGLIHIRTVAPHTDGVDGFIEATAGDYGLAQIRAALNVPLSDTVAFRGTVFTSQRDGYVDDDNFGTDYHNDRDRTGVRLQLGFEPNDSFDARLIFDYSEVDEVCCVAISRVDGLYPRVFAQDIPQAAMNPGSDTAIATVAGSVFTDFPYAQPLIDALAPLPGPIIQGVGFDSFRVAYNDRPRSTNEDQGLSFLFNWTFGNGMTLTSVSAWRAFETFDSIDGDFTGADIFVRTNDAEQDSFSQEFRLSGEFGNDGHYVAGVYYFGQEIKSLSNTPAGVAFNAYARVVDDDLNFLVTSVEGLLSLLPPGTLPPLSQPFNPDTFATNDFVQDQDGWAVFAQFDIPLSNSFELTLGARYTDETKKITGLFTDSSNGPPPDPAAIQSALIAASIGDFSQLPALLPLLQPNVSWGNYGLVELSPRPDVNEELSDDQTTGTVKLTWLPSDTSMFYLSFSTGFKSGGTNTDRIDPVFPTIFGPETSESIELGFKGDLGPVRISAALFQTDYDDFQANSFTGTGFNLQNAGDIETNGFEVEAQWNPTDNLELSAFYAYNKGDFGSFLGGTCWDVAVYHTQMPDPGQIAPGSEQCDRSGYPIPYNPENRAFLAATQNFDVGNNNLWFRFEASYSSEQFTDGDIDPFSRQDAYTILNLRIGYDIDSWNSTITAWGRNITDERYYHGSFDAPIQLVRMNSYPGEPSTFGLTFRKDWD